ncbi:MAG TPA: response regulator transcription factor [Nakamurella sp.]|nr:response regulator transcription factor [Nakamurella sp.]
MQPEPTDPPAGRGTVLVVEDEPAIAALVRIYLEREGFAVVTVTSGEEALDAAASSPPDAVILDIGLPGMDGLEVCRRLRAAPPGPPVLFVTARDDEVDRIVGLEIGGDDYITKPFSPRELVARVKAVLRRSGTSRGPAGTSTDPADPAAAEGDLVAGRVRMSVSAHRVWADGREVELTLTEFALLQHLMRRPGRVVNRADLLAQVWGYPDIASRTVDVHIAQLRAKLGDASPLRTVRGVGYAAEPAPGATVR